MNRHKTYSGHCPADVAHLWDVSSKSGTHAPPNVPAEQLGYPCKSYDTQGQKHPPAGLTEAGRPISRCVECTREWCWIRHRRKVAEPAAPVRRAATPSNGSSAKEYVVVNGTTRVSSCRWCANRENRADGRVGCGEGYLDGQTYAPTSKAVGRVLCGATGAFRWGI